MQTKTEMISKNQIKYIRQLEQKKFRKREKCFVAEGPKVVGDLMSQYQPTTSFFEGAASIIILPISNCCSLSN